MIIIKSLTNQVSVDHFNLSLQDVIRALVYCAVCLMVQCTREEICSSTQQHNYICGFMYQSSDKLFWTESRPMTLLIALISECILCLSIFLSHKPDIHTPSQLGSLQLVPMVIIISPFPSVYHWTVQAPMHIARAHAYTCTFTHMNTDTQTHINLIRFSD